ncbi:L,D-transpeptidase family protein [Rhodoferax lacus]|nr:L,D-transpeptidase [Rhodoferax lacus]
MTLLCAPYPVFAAKTGHKRADTKQAADVLQSSSGEGLAEARLLEVYRLMASGRSQEALGRAGKLVHDHPNFQLGQLVYGDLLAARIRPVNALGDVPADLARAGAGALDELRAESRQRVQALNSPPRQGTIPSQFLEISQKTKHAIAVDASRSRLYLFENGPGGLTLVANYYTSVGKAGVSKTSQGDQRTPLGVYYITSHLDAKSLKDFYGSGALPINYPNILDAKRGKTGGGIWLHGTPPNQFSRAPLASDGCLVMANPDLLHLIQTVEVGSTPVVIAPQLQWVDPRAVKTESKPFDDTLQAWRKAKVEGNLERVMSFYTQDFNSYGKTFGQWSDVLRTELSKTQGNNIELKDVSFLHWTDSADTMVVTFGEVLMGKRTGWTKRQYWTRQSGQWKIFFEGIL